MKKINWKDFKIKDEQPNLIQEGWDNFQEVGSGLNYVDNWDFSTNDLSGWFSSYGENKIINNQLVKTFDTDHSAARLEYYDSNLPPGKYMFRIKIKSEFDISIKGWVNVGYNSDTISASNDFCVWEQEIEILQSDQITRLRFYGANNTLNKKITVDWIQLTPIDNQHLVLEKTPLENGLTRVQTWGGGENSKLRFIQNSEKEGEPLSLSMYIENNGDDISLHHDAPSTNNAIEKGYKGFLETLTEVSVGKYKYIGIGTEGNLDFIASEPQFVEGDKANPVLLINELEDGREHVQVYGVKNDTKLISPKVEGISGEPYQIKTDIENNGIEMSMDSTLGDKSISVGKGENSVSHTGELQGQHIIIELGAKYE